MRVLAVDSASPLPALALLVGPSAENLSEEAVEFLGAGQAEALVRHLEALLSTASCEVSSLDRVAVLSGPGSFTGLRAGTAFARGLARALEVPLFLHGTFAAASAALALPPEIDFLLDAGRGEVHRARRRAHRLVESERPLPREAALAGAADEGISVRDLDSDPLLLVVSLGRLAATEPLSERHAGSLSYGRPSAAEEKLGSSE